MGRNKNTKNFTNSYSTFVQLVVPCTHWYSPVNNGSHKHWIYCCAQNTQFACIHKSIDPTNAKWTDYTKETAVSYKFGDNTGWAVHVYVCVVMNWGMADDRKPEILTVYSSSRINPSAFRDINTRKYSVIESLTPFPAMALALSITSPCWARVPVRSSQACSFRWYVHVCSGSGSSTDGRTDRFVCANTMALHKRQGNEYH